MASISIPIANKSENPLAMGFNNEFLQTTLPYTSEFITDTVTMSSDDDIPQSGFDPLICIPHDNNKHILYINSLEYICQFSYDQVWVIKDSNFPWRTFDEIGGKSKIPFKKYVIKYFGDLSSDAQEYLEQNTVSQWSQSYASQLDNFNVSMFFTDVKRLFIVCDPTDFTKILFVTSKEGPLSTNATLINQTDCIPGTLSTANSSSFLATARFSGEYDNTTMILTYNPIHVIEPGLYFDAFVDPKYISSFHLVVNYTLEIRTYNFEHIFLTNELTTYTLALTNYLTEKSLNWTWDFTGPEDPTYQWLDSYSVYMPQMIDLLWTKIEFYQCPLIEYTNPVSTKEAMQTGYIYYFPSSDANTNN